MTGWEPFKKCQGRTPTDKPCLRYQAGTYDGKHLCDFHLRHASRNFDTAYDEAQNRVTVACIYDKD